MYKMKNGKMVPLTQAEIDARTAEVSAYEATLPQIQKEEKVKELWEEADRIVNSYMDKNSRDRYLAWLIDSNSSQSKKDKINDNQVWADSIWNSYRTTKDDVINNNNLDATLPDFSGAPWTFWDIADS